MTLHRGQKSQSLWGLMAAVYLDFPLFGGTSETVCQLAPSPFSKFWNVYKQNTCPHACPTVSCSCWHVLSMFMCKNKSAGKQPLGKTLRIVLQPGGAQPGTVNSLSGTSAGHTQTHWGFVLGLSVSEMKWEPTVGLSLSTKFLPPFQGNTSQCSPLG